jgi:hypothetical protein
MYCINMAHTVGCHHMWQVGRDKWYLSNETRTRIASEYSIFMLVMCVLFILNNFNLYSNLDFCLNNSYLQEIRGNIMAQFKG